MTALRPFLITETRLYLREPVIALLTLALPTVLFLGLGAPATSRAVDPVLGQRPVDAMLPSLSLGVGLTLIGLFSVPAFLASYREAGLLRRLATTPVPPSVVLVAQLVISVVNALLGVLLVLLSGWFVVGMAAPRSAVGLALALLLGVTALLSVGLIIAAVAPSQKVASGLGFAVMVPNFFLGGVYVPSHVLPHWLRTVGEYTPVGALRAAVEVAQVGGGRLWLPLVILAAWSVLATGVARWTFRWQ
jgi:ABC-2 type transport system permease protein